MLHLLLLLSVLLLLYLLTYFSGRETTLMSVKDFYNCITPGSTITHGTGLGTYTRLRGDDARSQKIYDEEKLPISESLLNEVIKVLIYALQNKEKHSSFQIQRQGLLTFEDFAFLLNILSTPWRHMDVAFHSFDISADGKIEARVSQANSKTHRNPVFQIVIILGVHPRHVQVLRLPPQAGRAHGRVQLGTHELLLRKEPRPVHH